MVVLKQVEEEVGARGSIESLQGGRVGTKGSAESGSTQRPSLLQRMSQRATEHLHLSRIGIEDEDLEDEARAEREMWSNSFVVYEDNGFRRFWELVLFAALIYTAIVFPFSLCFVEFAIPWPRPDGPRPVAPACRFSPPWFYPTTDVSGCTKWGVSDEIINFIFWIDLVLNFFFTFQDKKSNREIGNLKKITMHYLKSFFLLNLIACLPSEYIGAIIQLFASTASSDDDGGTSAMNRLTRLTRLQRISRLSRLARLSRLFKLVSFMTRSTLWQALMSFRSIRILNFMVALFWSVHMLACGWYLCAAVHESPELTWVGGRQVGSEIVNGTNGLPEEVGIYLISQPRWTQWAHSMYFVLTVFTTVGFGDMSATTVGEILYLMVMMIIGCVIHGWIVSEMINVVSEYDQADIDTEQQMSLVSAFAQHTEVSEQTTQELQTWVSTTVRKNAHYDRDQMRNLLASSVLPRHLMEAFGRELFDGKLARNKLLQACSKVEKTLPPRFPLLLGLLLDWRVFINGEFVYFTHDQPFNIFIVLEGCFAEVARPSPNGGVSDWMPSLGIAAKQLFGAMSRDACSSKSNDPEAKTSWQAKVQLGQGTDILAAGCESPGLEGAASQTPGESSMGLASLTRSASKLPQSAAGILAGGREGIQALTGFVKGAANSAVDLVPGGPSGDSLGSDKQPEASNKPVLWPYMFHNFGGYFGDVELLDKSTRRSSIRCMARGSKCLVLAKKDMDVLIDDFPRVGTAWRIAAGRREYRRVLALSRLTQGRTCKDLAALTIQSVIRSRQAHHRNRLDCSSPVPRKKLAVQASKESLSSSLSPESYKEKIEVSSKAVDVTPAGCGESIARQDGNSASAGKNGIDDDAIDTLRLEVLAKQASLEQEMNSKLQNLHATLDMIRQEMGPLLKA